MGACFPKFSKLNIFSPEIDAVNYAPGRHRAAPAGRIVLPVRDELQLLHYHYLGFDRVRKRHAQFLTRQRKRDFDMRWGHNIRGLTNSSAKIGSSLRVDWSIFRDQT